MFSDLVLNAQYAVPRLPNYFKFKNLTLLNPFAQFSIDHKHYTVKIASNPDELAQALRLRFKVFFQEFSTTKIRVPFFPYDIDAHDFQCDHLIVKDKALDKVVAVYRLLHSDARSGKFYSESEFDLDSVLSLPGKKVELGRACVHKDYRSGTVIGLLWKGLIEYSKMTHADYLFGCSSLTRSSFGSFSEILNQLQSKNALLPKNFVTPKDVYNVDFFPEVKESLKGQEKESMNSLMHMYILAGAKMSPAPAYDEEMDCLDLFTIINMRNLPPQFERRFS